jgi:hypothetical protein
VYQSLSQCVKSVTQSVCQVSVSVSELVSQSESVSVSVSHVCQSVSQCVSVSVSQCVSVSVSQSRVSQSVCQTVNVSVSQPVRQCVSQSRVSVSQCVSVSASRDQMFVTAWHLLSWTTWMGETGVEVQVQVKVILRPTVNRPVRQVSASIWGPWPDSYYCRIFEDSVLWERLDHSDCTVYGAVCNKETVKNESCTKWPIENGTRFRKWPIEHGTRRRKWSIEHETRCRKWPMMYRPLGGWVRISGRWLGDDLEWKDSTTQDRWPCLPVVPMTRSINNRWR